jgi:hypothetical protein
VARPVEASVPDAAAPAATAEDAAGFMGPKPQGAKGGDAVAAAAAACCGRGDSA